MLTGLIPSSRTRSNFVGKKQKNTEKKKQKLRKKDKKMKKFIIGIISILAFTVGLLGDVPKSLPIGSRALLQAYALQNTAVVQAGIGSDSMIGGDNTTYFTRRVSNGVQGIEALRSAKFSSSVENPNDPVILWSQLSDKDGNVLASGRSSKKTVKSDAGVYRLTDNKVTMYYSSDILPIVYPDAQMAYVFIRNEKGETVSQDNIKVKNGKILFPVALAGKASMMVYVENSEGRWEGNLYMADGSLKVKPDSVVGGIEPQIDNTVFVTDSHLNNVVIKSEGGMGDNTLFVLTLNKKKNEHFFAKTSEGHFFTGYYIMKAGEEAKWWPTPKGFEVSQELGDGIYYIWFTWDENEFQEYERYYEPPIVNDEKG